MKSIYFIHVFNGLLSRDKPHLKSHDHCPLCIYIFIGMEAFHGGNGRSSVLSFFAIFGWKTPLVANDLPYHNCWSLSLFFLFFIVQVLYSIFECMVFGLPQHHASSRSMQMTGLSLLGQFSGLRCMAAPSPPLHSSGGMGRALPVIGAMHTRPVCDVNRRRLAGYLRVYPSDAQVG